MNNARGAEFAYHRPDSFARDDSHNSSCAARDELVVRSPLIERHRKVNNSWFIGWKLLETSPTPLLADTPPRHYHRLALS
jgi:hypothetical protein